MKNIIVYIIGIIICLGLGIGSGFISQNSFEWYHLLQQPYLNPPSWIFAPVWTILYIMMGIVLGHLYLYPSSKWVWGIFILQLICNFLWSPLFFYAHRIDLALLDLIILFSSLVIWMFIHRHQAFRFYLFLPYTLWSGFALYLNLSLYILN